MWCFTCTVVRVIRDWRSATFCVNASINLSGLVRASIFHISINSIFPCWTVLTMTSLTRLSEGVFTPSWRYHIRVELLQEVCLPLALPAKKHYSRMSTFAFQLRSNHVLRSRKPTLESYIQSFEINHSQSHVLCDQLHCHHLYCAMFAEKGPQTLHPLVHNHAPLCKFFSICRSCINRQLIHRIGASH